MAGITQRSNKSVCKECEKDFLIIPAEQTFYKKKGLSWPENCADCRRRTRLSLRNERILYKRKCDKCKKNTVSTYSENSEYTIYCQECFWEYLG